MSNSNTVSNPDSAAGAVTPQRTRGSGKWVTVIILVAIAVFFFSSVILNRIAMTQA